MVHQDPLGIMYLAAALEQQGHRVHFVDIALEPRWEERIVTLAPDVVGYSVITGSQGPLLEINRLLKKRFDFLSLWGGPHPTFFPELIEKEDVDIICIGEGEQAIVELAAALDAGDDFSSIANLHVKNPDGSITENAPRSLCENLDEIPFPSRSILSRYPQYRCVSSRAVIASRGCPYSCTFCFNSRLRELHHGKGKYSRRRSVENLIEECARYGADPWVRQILFKDDLFAHRASFVSEFADLYPREVGLPFSCNVRADRVTEQIADDLARAGVAIVHFGVESGNDHIRQEVLGRRISRKAMIDTARWFRERGVKVYTFNLLGIPGETPEEAFETLDLNAELGADIAMFSIFQPYPRTPLGDRAVELGLVDPGFTEFSASFYQNSMRGLPKARQFRNMVHLFPLASRNSMLRRAAPFLAKLPLTPAYATADFFYKTTKFVFDLRIVQARDVALYSGHWDPSTPPRSFF
jgi:anaerobic magnesium-protoporphyrin IX monomethyl ester cyclase